MDTIKNKYSIRITYSEEDKVYIAWVPELSQGCNAFGDTYEDALREIQVVIPEYIKCLKKDVPKPIDYNDVKYCCIKDDVKYFDNIWGAYKFITDNPGYKFAEYYD